MTERQTEIFRAFVRANDLTVKPDFRAKTKMYVGMPTGDMTETEIRRTPDFVGFVDGYEGRDNRFQGPKGSVDAAERTSGLDDLTATLMGRMAEALPQSSMIKQIGEHEWATNATDRYHRQHILGGSARHAHDKCLTR